MNIVLIDGSPKAKDSASCHLLNHVEAALGSGHHILWRNARHSDAEQVAQELSTADAVILACPLYVDGLPSHLIAFMQNMEASIPATAARVYAIINAGFYEGTQTENAIKMVKLWADKCRLAWGQGLGIGAGGMLRMAPLGQGPLTRIGQALDQLAQGVLQRQASADAYAVPNAFPRVIYKLAAHMNWRSEARQNGVSRKSIKRRLTSH